MSKREFELDLTSVCVGSGVVQLPLKMQSMFIAGDLLAIVDGEEVLLTFMEPRRLSGFKEHFERRGLRSNDKVRFEVDVDGEKGVALVAASIKRERNKPTQQRTPERAASGEVDPGAIAEQAVSHQAGSSWGNSDSEGQVRAVRKVRVEGGMPLPVSPATQQFSSPVRSDGARRADIRLASENATTYGGWTPLDGLSPVGEQQPPSLHDYPEATVREVRRSRVGTSADQAEGHTDHESAWATAGSRPSVPPLYSHGYEVTDQYLGSDQGAAQAAAAPPASTPAVAHVRSASDPVEAVPEASEQLIGVPVRTMAEAPPASTQQPAGETVSVQGSQQGYVAPPRIPVPRNTAAGSNWQPTPASGLNPAEPFGVVRQPRLIEETDLNPLRASAFETGRPMEPAREETTKLTQERRTPEASASTGAPRPPGAIDDAEFGGEYLPGGRSLEAALLHGSNGEPGRDPRPDTASRSESTTARPATQHDSTTAEVQAASHPAPGNMEQQSVPVRLEDDLRMVEAYLDRPNTPAIVRSEVIAAELGIDDQRSERALERLSENRDRVSRIRKGAYMVKIAPTGHSSRL